MAYITKHALYDKGITQIYLDIGAQFLSVGVEDDILYAYCITNPAGKINSRPHNFYVTYTDARLPEGNYTFISTHMIKNQVYHIFEII